MKGMNRTVDWKGLEELKMCLGGAAAASSRFLSLHPAGAHLMTWGPSWFWFLSSSLVTAGRRDCSLQPGFAVGFDSCASCGGKQMAQLVLKGDCLHPWFYKPHTLVFLFYAYFC